MNDPVYLIKHSTLQGISNAIHTKDSSLGSISVKEMANIILNLDSSGGTTETILVEKDINFYNYDGALLHSYTFDEANSLSTLPTLPSNTTDVSYAWTSSLDEIKECCENEIPTAVAISRTFASYNFGISKIYVTNPETERFKFQLYNDLDNSCDLNVICPNGTILTSYICNGKTSISVDINFLGSEAGVYTLSFENKASILIDDKASIKMIYDIEINDNYESIPNLQGCINLHSVIWNSTTAIPEKAFYGCVNLTNFEITKNITSISASAFEYCSSLKFLNVRHGVTTLGSKVFTKCYELETIIIPSTIGNTFGETGLFGQCGKLKFLTLPSNVTKLSGASALNSCLNLRLKLRDTVTQFDSSFLNNTGKGLLNKSVYFDGTATPSYCFSSCHNLESIHLSTNVTTLGQYTCNDCVALCDINLPETITTIPQNCFNNCISLETIVIPASVTTINSSAFSNCLNMKVYNFSQHTSVPTLSSTSVFTNIPKDCKILVPTSLLDQWKTTTQWTSYTSHITDTL
jgi:hypothetical protein